MRCFSVVCDYSGYGRKEGHVFGLFKADVSVAVASPVCNHVQPKRERKRASELVPRLISQRM